MATDWLADVRSVRDRLYTENRMSGDEMRDMAQRLDSFVSNIGWSGPMLLIDELSYRALRKESALLAEYSDDIKVEQYDLLRELNAIRAGFGLGAMEPPDHWLPENEL